MRSPLFVALACGLSAALSATASFARQAPGTEAPLGMTPNARATPAAPPEAPGASRGVAQDPFSLDAPPEDLLAGPSFEPKLGAQTQPRSLVTRDFGGALKPLEVRPEQAALDLLDLSPQQRSAAQRVLDDRAVRLDSIVRSNLKLLARGQTARSSNDPEERRAVFSEFAQTFGPLLDRGALEDEIAQALPPAQAQEYRQIVGEYWAALEQDSASAPATPRGGRQGPKLRAMGQEIKRSFERVVGQGRERLDAMLAELQLTPEQEAKIRGTIMDAYVKAEGKPQGRLQKLKLFGQIAKDLTPEQRARLRELAKAPRAG